MVNKALVDKVLRSLPPVETRPASALTENELKRCIDDALTVVMYWLKCIDNPDLDTEVLLRAYPARSRSYVHDEFAHLGYDILQNLMPWIRGKDGWRFTEHEPYLDNSMCADEEQKDKLKKLSWFIANNIYSNPIVTEGEQTRKFFCMLSYVQGGIYPFAELEMVIDCVRVSEILTLLSEMNSYSLKHYTARMSRDELCLEEIATITRIISNIKERSDFSRLEIIKHWVDGCGGFEALVKMQFDLIRQNVDRTHFPNLPDQLDALNVVLEDAQRCWFDMDLSTCIDTPKPWECMRDLNRLLLSMPGSEERHRCIERCQDNISTMQGHANPTMQKLGLILAAIGAAVMGIGLSPLLTTGAAFTIGAGVAGLITGLGLFVHNRQKGPAVFMQKIHDEIARSPQLVIGSTY